MKEETFLVHNRISWRSIFAGVTAVLAVSMLLSLLGIALGFALLDPESTTNISHGSGTAVTIWTIFALLVSLVIGGFIAGGLTGTAGAIHGFLVWALSLLIGIWLSAITINNAASLTSNAMSSMASAAGQAVTGGAHLANLGAQSFEELIPLPELDNNDIQIGEALQKTGIKELQPDYLKAQAEWTREQIKIAAKELVLNPNQSDQIIQKLIDTLKNRAQMISNSIDRNEVRQALVKNTSLTPQEADQVINNYFTQQNQFFNSLEVNIEKAKVQYAELKADAKAKAAAATAAAAKAALWSFIGLLIGLIVTMYAGKWGAERTRKRILNT